MQLAAIGVGLFAPLLLAGAGPVQLGSRADALDLTQVRAFDEFPLYDAGDGVDGLPLTAVLRRDDAADYVSFVYGDCLASDEQGCAPPLEIQVWPACKRNLRLYPAMPGAPVPELATVRGVPAAFFEEGDRLELQTGRSTVVVFGGSRSRSLRAARALRPVGRRPTSAPLPTPEVGAVAGSIRC